MQEYVDYYPVFATAYCCNGSGEKTVINSDVVRYVPYMVRC